MPKTVFGIRLRRSVWKGMEVALKTRKGYRDVSVDSNSVHMLREHLGSRTAGRVFQSWVGTPLENRNIFRRVLKPICRKLGKRLLRARVLVKAMPIAASSIP